MKVPSHAGVCVGTGVEELDRYIGSTNFLYAFGFELSRLVGNSSETSSVVREILQVRITVLVSIVMLALWIVSTSN